MKRQTFKEDLLSFQFESAQYSAFLAFLSNDLRNELTGIFLSVDMLQDDLRLDEQGTSSFSVKDREHFLKVILRSANRLLQMTNDMSEASHELRDQPKIDD